MRGVTSCVVGYSGGIEPNPTYKEMKDYTESVLVEYDSTFLSYEQILLKWKSIADLSQDSVQYRSAIFYLNDEQRKNSESFCKKNIIEDEHVYVGPVTKFFQAEERHQNFLDKLG